MCGLTKSGPLKQFELDNVVSIIIDNILIIIFLTKLIVTNFSGQKPSLVL